MKEYLNKKVEIREKVFSSVSSTCIPMSNSINTITGTITNIFDEFIEVDNKILVAIKYIYTIELVD